MKSPSRLLAAGSLLIGSACQDGVMAPDQDHVAAVRSASKISTGVRVDAEQGTDGSVTYIVRIRSNSKTLSSFQGAVSFEPGMFELRSQTNASVSGGMLMVNPDFSNGLVRFAAFTPGTFDASGVGTEVFRFVVVQVRPGDPAFTGTLDAIGNTPNGMISLGAGALASTIAGQACSGPNLWGDGNADGSVNITDAQQLARFSAGLAVGNVGAVTGRGDVTADGSVNIVDAQQIARFSVGLSSAARTSTWICS